MRNIDFIVKSQLDFVGRCSLVKELKRFLEIGASLQTRLPLD